MIVEAEKATTGSPAEELMQWAWDRYANDPVMFVREALNVEPDENQIAILEDYGQGKRLISIRSGHGVGKTTVLAWCVVHHILFRFPQKTVCTAPTESQLYDALASEIKSWIGKLPVEMQVLLDVKVDTIELKAAPNESFITFKTARTEKPEALQGVHSAWVLLIADEAAGIDPTIFEAAAGSMSGENAITMLAGNPSRSSGFFYDTHHKAAHRWTLHHISCEGHPRVTPAFLEDIIAGYGKDSNAYRVRVLGEFPVADDDTVISLELAETARDRQVTFPGVQIPVVWGVDCARFGDDRSTLAKRRGYALTEPVTSWVKLDTMQLAGRIKMEYDTSFPKPVEILVDVIGLGAGVVDRLREQNLPVRGINVSETPSVAETYANVRSELWFKMREWLARRDCKLVDPSGDLVRELVTPKYKVESNGKLRVESKNDMKKRGFRSPDLADAFMLTFASEQAALVNGRVGRATWEKPIKRNLKGIV